MRILRTETREWVTATETDINPLMNRTTVYIREGNDNMLAIAQIRAARYWETP
jgi:hypothetical protein